MNKIMNVCIFLSSSSSSRLSSLFLFPLSHSSLFYSLLVSVDCAASFFISEPGLIVSYNNRAIQKHFFSPFCPLLSEAPILFTTKSTPPPINHQPSTIDHQQPHPPEPIAKHPPCYHQQPIEDRPPQATTQPPSIPRPKHRAFRQHDSTPFVINHKCSAWYYRTQLLVCTTLPLRISATTWYPNLFHHLEYQRHLFAFLSIWILTN